jgi:hypothetical protein
MARAMPRRKKKYLMLDGQQEANLIELPSSSPDDPRWMNVHQAAKYIGSSTWHLRQLARDGKIPHLTQNGKGKQIFDRVDLDIYMNNHKTWGGD